LDVHALLSRTGDDTLLSQALQNAQSVGGPRWVDDHTCQVRLEISGSELADLLVKEAREHPERSPLTPDELRRRLDAWNKMTFFAVGSSAEGESIELAGPHYVVGAWSEVDETTRRRTVAAARRDAVQNILGTVSDIPLSPTFKVQDALARKAIMDRVCDFLNHQPVTRVEFLDDLRVSITLSTTPASFGTALQSAVMGDSKFSHDAAIDWKSVQAEIVNRVGPTAGTAWATPAGSTTTPAAPTAVILPSSPPDWADTQIESEATSSEGATRLKIARAAEAVATAKLREKFLALKVGKITLAGAAKADPELAKAVNRVMMHAHTYKVDYRADGSILVRVSLDLRNAWEELTGKP
jgi:hypothetical protein